MTKANTTRKGWAYEYPTPGTSALDGIGDTAYRFGDYSKDITKWQAPTIENVIAPYLVYNSRTPVFVKGGRNFPTFKEIFIPTTAQAFVWALGKCTDGAPDSFEPLAVGEEQYPLTIRWEETGGTTDRVVQAMGCYCVGLFARAYIGSPFIVETEWAFQTFADERDTTVCSEPLTTAPGAPGGADVTQTYHGNPIVTYDYGGGGSATLTDVLGVEWNIKRNYTPIPNADKDEQTIYLETFEPVDLVFTTIMESDSKWDDFVDFNVKDYAVQVKKPDDTNYIKCIFDDVHIIREIKTAEVYKGWVESKLICKAEKVTGEFTFEGAGAWATHFKGVVT